MGKRPDGLKLLSAFPNPLLQVSSDKDIVWANAAARDLLGADVVQKPLAKVFKSKALVQKHKTSLATNQKQLYEFTWSSNPPRQLSIELVPFETPTDLGGAVLLSVQDITAYMQLDRTRADFIANASHELRTPLSALVGFIETLQGPAKDDPEAREHFLKIMAAQAMRMTRLVEDLMSLSKIEMSDQEPPNDPIVLGEILSSIGESLSMQAQEKEITIQIKGSSNVLISGDSDQLTQVFWNLLENAIKYGRPKTSVVLRVKKPLSNGMIATQVIDEGEGIDKKHLPRITERFYRVDKARSRQMGGTGLGLAIVKHIINRHAGRLLVKSKLGVGSTFEVHLPAYREINQG